VVASFPSSNAGSFSPRDKLITYHNSRDTLTTIEICQFNYNAITYILVHIVPKLISYPVATY